MKKNFTELNVKNCKISVLFVLTITLAVLLSGTVSAKDLVGWDDYKIYDNSEGGFGTIEIWDKGQIGEDTKLKEYTLKENKASVINTYSSGIAILYEEGKLFDDIKYENKKLKKANFYIEVQKSSDKTYYHQDELCEQIIVNGTIQNICEYTRGEPYNKHSEYSEWEIYDGKKLPAGEYNWKLIGERIANQKIDWIPQTRGISLDEWAWYNATYDFRVTYEVNGSEVNLDAPFIFRMNITHSAGYTNESFRGIAVVDNACDDTQDTELYYDFDRITNESSANLWVREPALTTGKNYVCLYSDPDNPFYYDSDETWIQSNAVSIWLLNGNVFDETGRANGTENGINWTTNGSCYFGGCGWFTGQNITIGNPNNMFELLNITYIIWANSTNGDGGNIPFGKPATTSWVDPYFDWGISGGTATDVAFDSDGTWPASKVMVFDVDADPGVAGKTTGMIAGTGANGTDYKIGYKNLNVTVNQSEGYLVNISYAVDTGVQIGLFDVHTNAFTGVIDNIWLFNISQSNAWINRTYKDYGNITTGIVGAWESGPQVTIIQSFPEDYANLTDATMEMGCNVTASGQTLNSATLFLHNGDVEVEAFVIPALENSLNFTVNSSDMGDGTFKWSCLGNGSIDTTISPNRTINLDGILPFIEIDSPINMSNTSDNTYDVTYLVNDTNLQSCYYSNSSGSTNYSLTCGTNITTATWLQGINNITIWVNDSFGNTNESSITFYLDSISPNMQIVTPTNNSNWSNVNVNINLSVSDTNLQSCIWSNNSGVLNHSFTCGSNLTTITWLEGINNVTLWANDSFGNLNESSITFTLDTTAPTVYVAENASNWTTSTVPFSWYWVYNASDLTLDSCYYNTTETATYNVVTCNNTINTNWSSGGPKDVHYCANDTQGAETCRDLRLNIYHYSYLQDSNKDTIGEGDQAIFNLTARVYGSPSITAKLWYYNISYDVNADSSNASEAFFEETLTIPKGYGNSSGINQSWWWEVNMSEIVRFNTTLQRQNVSTLDFDNCTIYPYKLLNISLYDEESDDFLNITNKNVSIEAQVTLTSLYDSSITYTHNESWTANQQIGVCLPDGILNFSNYTLDLLIQFDSSDYVNEFYNIQNRLLTHTTSNPSYYTLRDLLLADSTSCLITYTDEDNLNPSNRVIELLRKYIGQGTFKTAERALTDDGGQTTLHIVEEDVIYKFNVSYNDEQEFLSSEYTILPESTTCTINLDAGGGGAQFPSNWSRLIEGTYNLSTDQANRIIRLAFNMNQSYLMNLTVYKVSNNQSEALTIIVQNTTNAKSGILSAYIPTSYGNSTFRAVVYKGQTYITEMTVTLRELGQNYFGAMGPFMAGLIVLTLALMAISQGIGIIIFALLGLVITASLLMLDTGLENNPALGGLGVVMYLLSAGIILIVKIMQRRSGD